MIKRNELSDLSLAVLGLVAEAPMTGYAIRKVFATTPMGRFSSSPGAIYPALQRLERDGLVTGTVENEGTLRPRRVYSPTEKGLEALKDALRRPVTIEEIIRGEERLILRFVFMEKNLEQAETARFLGQFAARTEEYLASLRQTLADYPADGPLHARLALGRGIEGHERDVRWARRCIEEITGNRSQGDTQ